MPALLLQILGIIGPVLLKKILPVVGLALLQSAPGLLLRLIPALTPTFSEKAPTIADTVASTTAVKTVTTSSDIMMGAPSNNAVTLIQELLSGFGQSITIDGELGPETIGALETSIGLVPGGVASIVITDLLNKA